MPYEQKDNQGILFKNDRKKSENSPDWTGNAKVNGTEYFMSAWVKNGKNGKFLSFAFSSKEDRQYDQRNDDDDLPI